MEEWSFLGQIRFWEHSLECRNTLKESSFREDLRRHSDLSQPLNSFPDDSEAQEWLLVDFKELHWRHHVEPGAQLNVRKEESFPIAIHWRDQGYTNCLRRLAGKPCWWGSRSVRSMDKIYSSQYWVGNIRTGTHGLESGWQEGNIKDRSFVARNLVKHVKGSSTERKSRMVERKTEAWQCKDVVRHLFYHCGRYGILGTMKKRTEEEVSMEASLSCKIRGGQCKEICGKLYIHRWMYTRAVEAKDSTRKRL